MVETVTAALVGAAGTTAGVAGATATTAATAGLIGSAGSVTLGGLFNAALTLGSAGLTIGGALGQAQGLQAQSQWQEFNAGQELLRGEQEANRVREALIRTLASNNASRAAAGVELSGSAETVDEEAARSAERELSIVRSGAEVRAGSARAGAVQTRAAASQALYGGLGRAGTSLFNFVERRRGIG